MKLYHYTTLSRALQIVIDGQIKQATAGVPKDEKPVVWFSFRQDWEPTATPAFGPYGQKCNPSFDHLVEFETPCRFEIDPATAPLNWRQWRKESGVKSKMVKSLEAASLRMDSNVADYRMTFDPVPENKWLALEIYLGGKWQALTEDALKHPDTKLFGGTANN
jgi:hypothetical protein